MFINRFFNLEAEVNVLGAILRDDNCLCSIIDFLQSHDFYSPRHQLIYKAAVKLYEEGTRVEIASLYEKLGASLKDAGGVSYLSELYASAEPPSTVLYYGEIIKEKANLKSIISLFDYEKKDLENKEKSCDEIIDTLENTFLQLRRKNNLKDGNTEDALMEVIDKLEKRYKNGGEIPGISTGYKVIDKMLGGFNREDFIILAARPSMGKTAMALNLALNGVMKEKAKVAFFNLEMGKSQILERALSVIGEIECGNIKTGSISDEEWGKVIKVS